MTVHSCEPLPERSGNGMFTAVNLPRQPFAALRRATLRQSSVGAQGRALICSPRRQLSGHLTRGCAAGQVAGRGVVCSRKQAGLRSVPPSAVRSYGHPFQAARQKCCASHRPFTGLCRCTANLTFWVPNVLEGQEGNSSEQVACKSLLVLSGTIKALIARPTQSPAGPAKIRDISAGTHHAALHFRVRSPWGFFGKYGYGARGAGGIAAVDSGQCVAR